MLIEREAHGNANGKETLQTDFRSFFSFVEGSRRRDAGGGIRAEGYGRKDTGGRIRAERYGPSCLRKLVRLTDARLSSDTRNQGPG